MGKFYYFCFAVFWVVLVNFPQSVSAQNPELPVYLRDRGTGIPTSMFGTYIDRGDVIVYPFFEYYGDHNAEYKPEELGYGLNQDFRARYRAFEGLIFLGFGITDRLALEIEASIITAKQYKSDTDPSAMPDIVKESGIGDVESQLRWRWNFETDNSPEFFTYFETVFPLQKNRTLIGTQDWELKLGSGIVKGFRWGTLTMRIAGEYTAGENKLELGEYAVEYLRRISDRVRIYAGLEGSQDELEGIADLQLHIIRDGFIRINNSFGLTSKATGYAPEIGILFYL